MSRLSNRSIGAMTLGLGGAMTLVARVRRLSLDFGSEHLLVFATWSFYICLDDSSLGQLSK
jgi:hypothetical protein